MRKAQAVGWGTGRGSGQPEKKSFMEYIDYIIIAKKTLKKLWLYFSTSLNKTTHTIARIQESSIGS